MPITLNCPKCRKPFRVRDESVGMRVKCPTCGAVLQVPATLAPTSMEGPPGEADAPRNPTPPAANPIPRESVFTGLPGASSTSGPPSLPQNNPMHRDEEDEPRRASTSGPLPPIPNTRRPAAKKQAPATRPGPDNEQVEQIIEDAAGWSSVRGGLRWIQIGLFFSMIYALYLFGIAIYAFREYNEIPKNIDNPPPGLLEIKKANLLQELEIFTKVGSGVLLFLFAMIGLLKCIRVPASARTRGLVSGTFLFALISFAGFLISCRPDINRLFEIPELPADVVSYTKQYFIYFPVLTIIWFVLFLGQSGAVLRSGKVLTDAAYSVLLIVLFHIGTNVADNYYPLTSASRKMKEEMEVQVFVTQAGIFTLLTVLIALRLMSLSGVVRGVIRRWKEENAAVLDAAAE